MLHFYRQSKLIGLVLFALCLYAVLPLIHAAQPNQYQNIQPTLCSSLADKPLQSSNTPVSPDSPTAHLKQCPICTSSANLHWALPPAPAVLPSYQQHISLLRLVDIEGLFLPAPSYTHPQSQAPPLVLL